MKPRVERYQPALVAVLTISLVVGVQWLDPGIVRRLEAMTYDLRARAAEGKEAPVDSRLGAVLIDDAGLRWVNSEPGYGFFWPWPRQLHGRVVKALTDAGAQTIAFDILFDQLHAPSRETAIEVPGVGVRDSDAHFAAELAGSRRVVLAAMGETAGGQWRALMPHSWFRTNCAGVGHLLAEADADGVLRRAVPFRDDPVEGRIWALGIVSAARVLGLDLDQAEIRADEIVLRGPPGVTRRIPLDPRGGFYIDWRLRWNDRRLKLAGYEEILSARPDSAPAHDWTNTIVFIGSIASGNNVSDVGATPVSETTYLVSKHWNVANMILTDRFIHPPGRGLGMGLVVLMGALAAWLTWRLRAMASSAAVVVTVAVYSVAAFWLFARHGWWIPVVAPVGGAFLLTHVSMVTYRVVFEQQERKRVKGIFARIVAPEVVEELLDAEKLALGGERRSISVLFADIRGFTELTDIPEGETEAYSKSGEGDSSETARLNEHAREILATVNLYLGTVAQVVKANHGTLDKYIGDCVMAFWGAPVPDRRHAAHCVTAAIEAQQAIFRLNESRRQENQARQAENERRSQAGDAPRPMLPVLHLGSGISSGTAIVGLMGSEEHILNYTIFGREVNLASRLEGMSGHGHILISAATHRELLRDAPGLAALCVELPDVQIRGLRNRVKIHEVRWNPDETTVKVSSPVTRSPSL